jgi:hypothetical protein
MAAVAELGPLDRIWPRPSKCQRRRWSDWIPATPSTMSRLWGASLSRVGREYGACGSFHLRQRNGHLGRSSHFTIPFRGQSHRTLPTGSRFVTTLVATVESRGFMTLHILETHRSFRATISHAQISAAVLQSDGMAISATSCWPRVDGALLFMHSVALCIGMADARSAY